MWLYSCLRNRYELSPRLSSFVTGLWFGVLLYLIFIGLSQEAVDMRYANI